jgi:hypothetical protein
MACEVVSSPCAFGRTANTWASKAPPAGGVFVRMRQYDEDPEVEANASLNMGL